LKSIVVYTSFTGFTKKYAEWIAEELGSDLFELKKIKPERMAGYDAVIFGGSLRATGISGLKQLKSVLRLLKGKKIAVFAVGASPYKDEAFADITASNFTEDDLKVMKFFYLRGGFDFTKLDFANKLIMNLMKWSMMMKKNLTEDEAGMLSAFEKPVDYTERERIKDLVGYIRS